MIPALAIVVPAPAPPPPPVPSQQGQSEASCKYSVEVLSERRTYRCYSEAEYQQKLASEAAQREKDNQAFINFLVSIPGWLLKNWLNILIWIGYIFAGLVVLIICAFVKDEIHRKRHPEEYNEFGMRKDWRL